VVVYVEDAEDAVDVEMLNIEEANAVLARLRGELSSAYNCVHAASLRQIIGEVEGQVEWLQAGAAALDEAAVEYAMDLWADYDMGLPM
jgi:hypothetical protein